MEYIFKFLLFLYNPNLIWEENVFDPKGVNIISVLVKEKNSKYVIVDYIANGKGRFFILKQALRYFENIYKN